jgi:hypothetical protein
MLQRTFQLLLGATISIFAPLCFSTCLQDEYGVQFNITLSSHAAVTGSATNPPNLSRLTPCTHMKDEA